MSIKRLQISVEPRTFLSNQSQPMGSLKPATFITLLLLAFLSFSEARQFLVGGSPNSWKIPESDPETLDIWAEEIRFRIGDSIVWKYDGGKDSVLEVTKDAFISCNTSNPIAEHTDGNTTVNLTRSGPYYFISGAPGHCEKGQKLQVIVLSTKHLRPATASPAPSPAGGFGGLPTGHGDRLEGLWLAALGALMGLGYILM